MAEPAFATERVRRHDNDRFLSTLFAPPEARDGLSALYAFNLEIAGIRESVSQPELGLLRLAWWRQAMDDIHHLGVAQVRHVLLEGQPENQNVGTFRWLERIGDSIRHVGTHAVVDAAPGKNDLGFVSERLGAMGQVIGIHTDAMTADQPRGERQEIPLGRRRLENIVNGNPQLREYLRDFVDEGDVDVV